LTVRVYQRHSDLGVRLLFCCVFGTERPVPLADPLQHYIENRNQENSDQRGKQHARDDRGAERPAGAGARARGDRQRERSEDERERGHQDRPQPQRRALIAPSMIEAPCSCAILANSTIRIAFLAASPISMISPICVYTSFGMLRSVMPVNAPITPNGITSSIATGMLQLSYSAASTRNTKASDSAKTNPVWPPVFFSW